MKRISLLAALAAIILNSCESPRDEIAQMTAPAAQAVVETEAAKPSNTATASRTATSTLVPTAIETPTSTAIPSVSAQGTTEASQEPGLADLDPVPDDYLNLEGWLSEQRVGGQSFEAVMLALREAGWATADSMALEVDLTDATAGNEWAVALLSGPPGSSNPDELPPGNLVVVSNLGTIYDYGRMGHDLTYWSAPQLVASVDATGDGLTELVVESRSCDDASNCSNLFDVLTGHSGAVETALQTVGTARGTHSGIVTAGSLEVIEDGNEFGAALVVGQVALPVTADDTSRATSHRWDWNGHRMLLTAINHLPSFSYRPHALYEANRDFDNPDRLQNAENLYQRVIHDEILVEVETPIGHSRNGLRQYAAFRLALASLLRPVPNEAAAVDWRDWLLEQYPDTLISSAAAELISTWADTGSVDAACERVTETVSGDRPLGYWPVEIQHIAEGDPILLPYDLCPRVTPLYRIERAEYFVTEGDYQRALWLFRQAAYDGWHDLCAQGALEGSACTEASVDRSDTYDQRMDFLARGYAFHRGLFLELMLANGQIPEGGSTNLVFALTHQINSRGLDESYVDGLIYPLFRLVTDDMWGEVEKGKHVADACQELTNEIEATGGLGALIGLDRLADVDRSQFHLQGPARGFSAQDLCRF